MKLISHTRRFRRVRRASDDSVYETYMSYDGMEWGDAIRMTANHFETDQAAVTAAIARVRADRMGC